VSRSARPGSPAPQTQPGAQLPPLPPAQPGPQARLASSDRAALRDLTRFGVLGASHLGAWHFGDPAGATSRLAALERARLVRSIRPHYGGRVAYLATPAGARAGGAGLGSTRFVPALATHHLAVADLAVILLRDYPGAAWTTERELRRLAGRATPQGEFPGHPPDGALLLHGRRLAMEVELTAKSPGSYRRIMRWYAAALEFDAVVWFCPYDRRRRRLFEGLRELIDAEGLAGVGAVRPLPPGVDTAPWG
jgi:hypothetical protein